MSDTLKRRTPLSEANTAAAWPKEEDRFSKQHGLHADGYGGPQLRPEIVILGGGDKHPYGLSCPAKSKRTACRATRVRNCVTWKCTKQFPFYYDKE